VNAGVTSLPPRFLHDAFAWMRGLRRMGAPMSEYTSLRVGGVADLFLAPADLEELRRVMGWSQVHGVPVIWLGRGSNLIVRDQGIRGIVVSLQDALHDLTLTGPCSQFDRRPGEFTSLRAGAGVPLTRVLHVMIREGLEGLAFAVGIPGTVGGAVVMNAGTEVGATWDVVERVRLLLADGRLVEVSRDEVRTGYRTAALPEQSVVLEATFRAVQGSPERVREEVRALYRRRLESQPLAHPNAGSIFKNPAGEHAGRLIEQAGLKGCRIGNAQVSTKHANFIVNLGQASAAEVLALIGHIKRRVQAHAGLLLEEEVRIVGE
jgi:UDP-N-acetylmuramate dehydrogenase